MKTEDIDKILDNVQAAFVSLLSEKGEALKQPTIERWRWDEPGITLAWFARDHIGRNIHASVAEPSGEPRVEIQVNAWKDEDTGPDAAIRLRHWRHDYVDSLKIPFQRPQLDSIVTHGYEKVSDWNNVWEANSPHPLGSGAARPRVAC